MKFNVIVQRYIECGEFATASLVGQQEFVIEAKNERQAELLVEAMDFNCDYAIPEFYPIV